MIETVFVTARVLYHVVLVPATSRNKAASIITKNLSGKAWLAYALAKIVSLVFVTLAIELLTAAASIDSSLLAVLVELASGLSNL